LESAIPRGFNLAGRNRSGKILEKVVGYLLSGTID